VTGDFQSLLDPRIESDKKAALKRVKGDELQKRSSKKGFFFAGKEQEKENETASKKKKI